jgi:hypothetical protein
MPDEVFRVDDVAVWLDAGGGITIKAVTPTRDPVELSATQARELAALLLRLAGVEEDS